MRSSRDRRSYERGFPHADGYDLLDHTRDPTVVVKAETSDAVKTRALAPARDVAELVLSERENVETGGTARSTKPSGSGWCCQTNSSKTC